MVRLSGLGGGGTGFFNPYPTFLSGDCANLEIRQEHFPSAQLSLFPIKNLLSFVEAAFT